MDFPGGSDGKASLYNAGDQGSNPGSGRSAGEGNSNPLQYYCLENPMNRGAWKATVHGVSKSRTRLSNFTCLLAYHSIPNGGLNILAMYMNKMGTNQVAQWLRIHLPVQECNRHGLNP